MSNIEAADALKEKGEASAMPEREAGDEVTTQPQVKANVEAAVLSEDGAFVAVGWMYAGTQQFKGFAAAPQGADLDAEATNVEFFEPDQAGIQLHRVERPDVSAVVGDQGDRHRHGFVLVVPEFPAGHDLVLVLENGVFQPVRMQVTTGVLETESALQQCLISAGSELFAGLLAGLGERHVLTQTVRGLLLKDIQQVSQLISCDQAVLIERELLLINGWVGTRKSDIRKVVIKVADQRFDVTDKLSRYPRPDLREAFPKAADEALGFIGAVTLPKPLRGAGGQVSVKVAWQNGETEIRSQDITVMDWPELHGYLRSNTAIYPLVIRQLRQAVGKSSKRSLFATRLTKLHELVFPANTRTLPTMVEHPDQVIVAIDRAFALGQAGMLVYGWKLTPRHKPLDVTIHDEQGNQLSVKGNFLSLVREDVASSYRDRFPGVSRRCGFILHVPLPTEAGDARAICFHYAERGDVWLRLPVDQRETQGISLIKEMMGMIPNPEQLNHYLHEMFNAGLGTALEAVNQQRLADAPAIEETREVRQFGTPPEKPTTSIIVPLYGRCDFMRHQLARFADDAELASSDLIYVVDDPGLVEQTLGLAARYQWLFNVPFRVVWYGRNLGFAGANNAGAQLARADKLLLLNSDVIPQQPGWLGTLEAALDELPEAGAVGPLLQFGDGSIQHAGMHPRRDPQLPGFLLNTHPGMGLQWEGGDAAYEQPLLTAACLMLRTEDYADYGGFDEGYVIGDFEDSDLCLGLRTQGKRLYVVPEARLWHLERQSQTLGNVAGVRQLITLFNGWRYQQKITRGELVDPMEITLGQEAQA